MPTMQIGCMFTVLKNTSGARLYIGMIQRGRYLDVDEEISIPGDIWSVLGSDAGPESSVRNSSRTAFNRLLQDGSLQILSTPAGIIQDITTEEPVIIAVDDGTVGSAPACFTESDSGS